MIEIIEATKQHIPIIREIAEHSWPVAFAAILSAQQIEYMMQMMYDPASMEKQINEGHQYAIAQANNIDVGYVSYEMFHNKSDKTKIHNTKAINFYKKHHFFLTKEEVIDIGNGFIMDDYVFELTLNQSKL